MNVVTPLKAADFATDQEVRWCPGCGDYAILKGVQRTMAELGARPEKSGIRHRPFLCQPPDNHY